MDVSLPCLVCFPEQVSTDDRLPHRSPSSRAWGGTPASADLPGWPGGRAAARAGRRVRSADVSKVLRQAAAAVAAALGVDLREPRGRYRRLTRSHAARALHGPHATAALVVARHEG